MIAFTLRQMHPEDRATAIADFCLTQLFDQLLDDTQPTGIRGLNSNGQFILNGGWSDHRRLTTSFRFVDSLCRTTLASR